MSYKLILVPEKAVIPEDIGFPVKLDGDIIAKIHASETEEIIVPVNTRELQMLVEYRDLFHVEIRAVIGLTGAMYNTIWNTYVSTMKRVTVDNLKTEAFEKRNAMADAGQKVETNPEVRERAFGRLRSAPAAETASDDSKTGDIE